MPPAGTDLEIRISLETRGGMTSLTFTLNSPSGKAGYTYETLEGRAELVGSPEDYERRLFATLEKLNQGLGLDESVFLANQGEVERELEAFGRELYEELFPQSFKAEYEKFRAVVRTVLLVSDEPWIPWELVRPPESDFLCCQFEMTRWLAGSTVPSADLGTADLGVSRVACLAAPKVLGLAPLPFVEEEIQVLRELAGAHSGVEELIFSSVTYDDVERVLREGGCGILHFVGHGEFEEKESNVSRFFLADGRFFRPRDLLYPGIENRIRQDRPLVFFNSCQAAQQGFRLTRLGGWAPRWIQDCGCGAFLGPRWSVRDAAGLAFAKAFYEALGRGGSFGRSVLEARLEARGAGGITWLAYVAYARPDARLRLGLGPTPLRIVEQSWREGISPPGALLQAEYGIVPFHGRDEEMADLQTWSADSSPLSIRLYTGEGGMGKTRLALELCKGLRSEGWQAGFLAPDPSRSPEQVLADLRGRSLPSLVVVDYAESRRELLVPILRELYRRPEARLRLVLLARAALDWWMALKEEGEGVGELLSGPCTRWLELRPLAKSVEARRFSYQQAALAFSTHLHRPLPTEDPAGLEDPHFQRVLLLHMMALAAVEGVAVQDEDGIFDYVLRRERRFWKRLAKERSLAPELVPAIGRAMALITLGGGATSEAHAVEALSALQAFEDQPAAVLIQFARLLHEVYPGSRWIEPILPDLLGEHLVLREMEAGADELLDLTLRPEEAGG